MKKPVTGSNTWRRVRRRISLIALAAPAAALAQNEVIELAPTTITGNTELPKYLYVVPWQDKQSKNLSERSLKLHNLYGDLFDPVLPAPPSETPLSAQLAEPPPLGD